MFFTITVVLLILLSTSCGLSPCDKKCAQNEEFSINASQCQLTCWRRSEIASSKSCKIIPGCVCKRGFIRHPDSFECVSLDSCPPIMNHAQCPRNEIYLICSGQVRACEKSCDDKGDNIFKSCVCRNGCTCKKGFFRSSLTSQCVESCEGNSFTMFCLSFSQ
jgi:Trypsin Inhibitor like cysteine rich domain